MSPGGEPAGRAPAIGRSARVLELLAHDGPVTGSRIGAGIGLAKSSTSDLLSSLVASRWVRRTDTRFALGRLPVELCDGFVGPELDLVRFGLEWAADPMLHQQTVSVQVVQGTELLCVDVRVGRQVIAATPRPGDRHQGWHGDHGDPAFAVLAESTLRSTLDRFAGFQGLTLETRRTILDWAAAERAQGGPTLARRGGRGNDELSVPCADDRAAVLTAHLPPGIDRPALAELGRALTGLAERCQGRRDPAPAVLRNVSSRRG